MKKCNKCHEFKSFDQFHKNKVFKDGYAHYCKLCRSIYSKTNLRVKEYDKEYRNKNKDKLQISKRNYYNKNKQEISLKKKRWYQDTKSERNKYYRERRKTNVNIKIKDNCCRRINSALKSKKNNRTIDLVGCSIQDLKVYLENKFQDGMTWDNYGKWHIDHIRPCASFDLTNPEQQKECFHYTNLQPLWAIDNIKKSCK